jgi:predicted transcriptional regulator
MGATEPIEFESYQALAARFHQKYRSSGGATMHNVKVSSGSVDAFFKRSHERAVKLDRKAKLPTDLRITFEDPADLIRALSVQRVRMLQVVRRNPRPTVTRLATMLRRDRKSVIRDVPLWRSWV